MVSPSTKRRRHPSVSCVTDKYDLDLRFRPHHREYIASARHCDTFKLWNDQTQEKFGFIPLGDLTLPPIDLQKQSQENIFDIPRRIKVSGTHNFMQTQIQIQSQLKPDVWQKYLTNYLDSQLVLLLRYGFPLDFDYSNPLHSIENNKLLQLLNILKMYERIWMKKKSLGSYWVPFTTPQSTIFMFHHS